MIMFHLKNIAHKGLNQYVSQIDITCAKTDSDTTIDSTLHSSCSPMSKSKYQVNLTLIVLKDKSYNGKMSGLCISHWMYKYR